MTFSPSGLVGGIIILASVVILTISKNNPITSAKEATFKEDIRSFQSELSIYVGNEIIKDYHPKKLLIIQKNEYLEDVLRNNGIIN